MQTRFAAAVLFAALLPGARLGAQAALPAHWVVATDDGRARRNAPQGGSDSTHSFVTMAPGWHVTMGPGSLLYDPRMIAEGRFDLEMEFFIFPDAAMAEMGLFVGGSGLDGAGRAYTAFVLRPDGQAAVLRREGGRERALMPWTPVPAIVTTANGGNGRNVLRVAQDSAGVHLRINGTTLRSWARSDVPLDGHYGFRAGPSVNLHITRLDLTARHAPVPPGRD